MHCFNESAPLANIFDCMKGHNRKLNRLREWEHNDGSGAIKTGFSSKRIGAGEGASGVGGGVGVNP